MYRHNLFKKTILSSRLPKLFSILFAAVVFISCSAGEKQESLATGNYAITPLNLRDVKLTDDFWLPIVRRIQEKTIPYALKKCEEEGRLDNFLVAGGEMAGSVRGKMPFDDTDVYKII